MRIFTLTLLFFWAVSLHHLDVVPPVYEDEPWQASTAYKLATQGVFGSDLFAGFYHKASRSLYLLAGLLTGLAGLAHLYGAFWLPALLLLTMWQMVDSRWRIADGKSQIGCQLSAISHQPSAISLLLLGFFLAWLPYLLYVASDLPDFRGQNQIYGYEGRFDLLNPAWYWRNLLAEPKRYGPGLGPIGRLWLLRVGLWNAAVGLPLSLGALVARAMWQRDEAGRLVVVPLAVIAGLFALLVQLKLVNYSLTLMPLAAIGGAWGMVQLWRRVSAGARPVLGRSMLAILLLAIMAEGGWRIATLQAAALRMTPYAQFIGYVRKHVPENTRILALHNYWFGLNDHDFRAFWVPLRWTDSALVPDPVPFNVALERVAPDVVLLDQRMRGFFNEAARPGAPGHDVAVGFWMWMERHGARHVARLDRREDAFSRDARADPSRAQHESL